ncbi:MAG TPA: hypothetical protein VFC63_08955 [Blastocatellia bacterium]|nr:hypothetical protein [Blastocatellia bacterium]
MRRELSPRIPIGVHIAEFGVLALLWALAFRDIIRHDSQAQRAEAATIFLCLFTAIPIWQILTHKEVFIDDQYLYVRSRKDEIQIPLSEMKKVHYSIFRKSVIITLKSPTIFGQRVSFNAEPRWGMITEPKIAEELRDIIDSLKDKPNSHKQAELNK